MTFIFASGVTGTGNHVCILSIVASKPCELEVEEDHFWACFILQNGKKVKVK
jgi:hypothetical protein